MTREYGSTRVALAVDVGGTKLEAALVTDDGVIVHGSRIREATGRAATAESLRAGIRTAVAYALASLPSGGELIGAGIGSAGPVDRIAGTIRPVNMPVVRCFGLRDAVRAAVAEVVGRDVHPVLGHDGGAFALAESWIGSTRDARSSLAVVVSTGIGAGFVIDGRYLDGASGNAGHLGQMRCGQALTLEERASGPASVAWARAQGWPGETGEDLARAAAAGDSTARAAIERSAAAVGAALADVATLFDLDVVAIGGGFSRVSTDYVDIARRELIRNAGTDFARRTAVVRSSLGHGASLVGAAALVFLR